MMIRLNDIYPAIQGEGFLAGRPMVLVRLQGCAVGCAWCDTKETWFKTVDDRVETIDEALGTNRRWCDAEPRTIADRARVMGPKLKWVLLTGGEPAEQDLKELVAAFHAVGFRVAIETSGTALGHINVGIDWVCVSPKFNMTGGLPVLDAAFDVADEIKMVVGGRKHIEILDRLLARVAARFPGSTTTHIVSLQPLSQSTKATEICIATCFERGWNLSLQMHKYLGER